MADNNIKVLEKEDENYPWFLANMDDSPERLYYIGDISLLKKTSVAVVGARKCSEYGRQIAKKTGEMLAKNNIVTISGMARGIDAIAHSSALDQGGKSIAVLGCGVDICYPKHNRKLYDNLCQGGLVVSEYPPGTEPLPWRFPRRNRIISALSQAVVVVEAGVKSGSLITAVTAATQGKEVFAVPGNINSQYSMGTNKLIRDGAIIITELRDILDHLDISAEPVLKGENLGEDELLVYKQLEETGVLTCDYLCSVLNKSPSFINGIVTTLEIKGLISCSNGKIFVAKF